MVVMQTIQGDIVDEPTIVPVVTPEGKIRNVRVWGVDTSGWLVGSVRAGWKLRPELAIEGYRMLEDLYRLEGDVDGWERYQRYLEDWQAGRTRRPFPGRALPRQIQG